MKSEIAAALCALIFKAPNMRSSVSTGMADKSAEGTTPGKGL
jgi:hypothetical protein